MDRFKATPVSHTDIDVTGGFWQEKQKLFRDVTVNAVYDRFQETGRMEAMKMRWKEGDPQKPHIFWESDVTKWIEGAACFLSHGRDPELEAKIDELVADMAATQGEDGYLNTYFTVVEPEARFTRRTDHELYCAGHLTEGAIAYAQATGKTAMLEISKRYLALIDRVFRVERTAAFDTPGHQEIELALLRLYDYTGEEQWKNLAEFFLEERGQSDRDQPYDFTDHEHMQSHLPVRKQYTAEGHSVRALYMYSGMADLARESGDEELFGVCRTLFENITERRMYITGGVGSTCRGESFTFDYDLPDYTAYAETCASIALAMFCRRMWLMDPDGAYADTAELAIYNTVLGGVSLGGDSFFYENPLAANPARNKFNDSRPQPLKEHLPILERVKVFDCSCCPPNLLRIVGGVADYQYSVAGDTLFAHCYLDSAGEIALPGGTLKLRQETRYPYEGAIKLTFSGACPSVLALRIPAWTDGKAFISVNGEAVTWDIKKGYAYLERDWTDGDVVVLELPMEVRVLEANPLVTELCGRYAVLRGPLVFCAEGLDHGAPIRDLRLSRKQSFETDSISIGGTALPVIHATGHVRKQDGRLYASEPFPLETIRLRLIPYHAWANRGVTEMTVWLLAE